MHEIRQGHRDGGTRGRLHAHDAHVRVHGLGRHGNARDQAAASHRHHDGVNLRVHGHDLVANRSLAGIDARVAVAGINVEELVTVDVVKAQRQCLVVVVTHLHDAGAVKADAVELVLGRVKRHDNHAVLNAQQLAGVAHRYAVVAGRDGAHAALDLVARQLCQHVEGTTNLEALSQLLAFELEAVAMLLVVEVDGVFERRPPDEVSDTHVGHSHVLASELL